MTGKNSLKRLVSKSEPKNGNLNQRSTRLSFKEENRRNGNPFCM